jgi:hypothetical protein
MNIPPQSRNCMVRVTLPDGRRRYTSLRPFIHFEEGQILARNGSAANDLTSAQLPGWGYTERLFQALHLDKGQ